jgi:hypothetical protein
VQGLTDPPRDAYTDAQILALLHASDVTVDAGCELLAADLSVVEDITGDFQNVGGSVVWGQDPDTAGETDPKLDIQGQRDCTFGLTRALNWGSDLVRLYKLHSGAGLVNVRFNVGVFCLTTPDLPVGVTPAVYQVTGFDLLYLLRRQVGDSYSVSAGSSYIDAVQQAISDAGLSSGAVIDTSGDATLPTDMVWPLIPTDAGPTTWLQIVNELLAAIHYDPLWCDENGLFRSQPHVDPSTRTPEYFLDADDVVGTIVGVSRSLTQDVFATPNTWVFVQQDFQGTPVEGAGIYTVVNQSDGLASIDQRGLVYADQRTVAAANQATLESLGDAQVAKDRATATTLQVTTRSLPIAGQGDVIAYSDVAAGGFFLVQATGWSLPLDGGDMTWALQST